MLPLPGHAVLMAKSDHAGQIGCPSPDAPARKGGPKVYRELAALASPARELLAGVSGALSSLTPNRAMASRTASRSAFGQQRHANRVGDQVGEGREGDQRHRDCWRLAKQHCNSGDSKPRRHEEHEVIEYLHSCGSGFSRAFRG